MTPNCHLLRLDSSILQVACTAEMGELQKFAIKTSSDVYIFGCKSTAELCLAPTSRVKV